MSSSIEIPKEIQDVLEKETAIVPFLGSAASLFEPTSLPSWISFLKLIISAIDNEANSILSVFSFFSFTIFLKKTITLN